MLLPGGKWESIERREKLCGVVFVHGRKKKEAAFPRRRLRLRSLACAAAPYCSEVGATYLATTYQRQCSKELFKFQGR